MDVGDFLRRLGLQQYEPAFRDNGIDSRVLPKLTAEDVKDLGVTMIGHRRLLLEAIAALREPTAPAIEIRAEVQDAARVPSAQAASTADAERRQLTVMFGDLIGSTALSSRLDPEDLREVLRTYQACVATTIRQFDGFIARYVGDGVLIYFGWPEARETDAERAVRAGLAVAAAVGAITPGGEPLQVRIGIATGLVVIGEPIGSGDSRQQTAVGETPNLAARLQGLAGPNEVVIDVATRRQIGGLFDYAELGAIALKGFAAPVVAARVLRESAAESRFEALRASGTPFVGRHEELALLLRRWQQAAGGEGSVVLISGEPGIGKSRLAQTLLQRLAGEPHIRLRLFCSPHHQDSALYPSITQLERAAGLRREDTAEQRLDKLEAVLARATGDAGEAAPLLAELLSIPAGKRYPPLDLTPQKRKEKTLLALRAQVEALAAQQPVLLLFEDAHWSDPTSIELLDLIVDRTPALPMLLLVTFRPEFTPPWVGQPHVSLLSLNRLPSHQRAEMIAGVTGGKALPEDVAEQIIARTDGVPLFVEELTKAVLESGLLTDCGDHYTAMGPAPAQSIPATLQASLLARLDSIAPARRIAQIGAALGRSFSHQLISAVAPMPQRQIDDSLAQLVGAELIYRRGTPPDAEYTFKHGLIQDSAYGTLLRGPRQQLHTRIAATLEDQFPEIVANDPERLARHYVEAGEAKKAIECWRRAAEASISRSANVEAVRQTERALEVLLTLPKSAERDACELRLLVPRGVGLQGLYGYGSHQVHTNYARAHEICRTVSDIPELIPVLRGLYVHHLMQGRLSAAHEIGSDLLRLADQAGDEGWRIEARFAFGQTLALHEADFERARDLLSEGEALYHVEKHGRHALIYGQDPGVYCLVLGGWVHYFLGYPDTALNKVRQAILLADTVGHPLSRAAARCFTIQLLQWLRIGAGVPELTAETRNIAESHGLPFFQAWADASLAWVMICGGQIGPGRGKMVASIDDWLTSAGELIVPYLRCLLAEAYTLTGEYDKGFAEVTAAFAMAERNGDRVLLSEMYRLAGHVSEAAQQLANAEELYEQAIHIARRQRAKSLELRAAIDLARLWAGRGETSRAATILRPLCAFFVEGLTNQDFIEAKCLMERCAADSGSFNPLR